MRTLEEIKAAAALDLEDQVELFRWRTWQSPRL
jgi:hypothetical protein